MQIHLFAVANTELWNGTSWTEVNDLSTARNATKGTNSTVGTAIVFLEKTLVVPKLNRRILSKLANKTITAS